MFDPDKVSLKVRAIKSYGNPFYLAFFPTKILFPVLFLFLNIEESFCHNERHWELCDIWAQGQLYLGSTFLPILDPVRSWYLPLSQAI